MPENDLDEKGNHGQLTATGIGQRSSAFTSSRLPWMICGVLLVLLIASLWHSSRSSRHIGDPDSDAPYFRGHPGPWGQVEFARIYLEPADAFIPVDAHFFGTTRWFFENYTRETLGAFFGRCGLSAAQHTELMDPAIWTVETNGILVLPRDELVLGLAAPARAQIYSVLAQSRQNILELWPFRARSGTFDDWFEGNGLSPGTIKLLKQLVYTRGPSLCFSDLPIVFPRIATDEERRRLMKTLAHTPALLMKLKINPDSDADALADYWAKGWRSKDIQILLESLKKIPGGTTLDVAHLLTPFARKRLYTYPIPPANRSETMPNCFWTAMNFYNDTPDDRFYDRPTWEHELEQNYTEVSEPTFGDLIFFETVDGLLIHACVYVADDVVFTKNGDSYCHPWILMKWDDLVADYAMNDRLKVRIFRPKFRTE